MEAIFQFNRSYLESEFMEIQKKILDQERLIFLDYGGSDSQSSLEKSMASINENINMFCLWSGYHGGMKPKIIGDLDLSSHLINLKCELYSRDRNKAISNVILHALSHSEKIALTTLTIYPHYMKEVTVKLIAENSSFGITPVTYNSTSRKFTEL